MRKEFCMLDLKSFKREFVSLCRSSLCEYGPADMKIEERKVSKAQRGALNGLLFVRKGTKCAPTLYVEDFYKEYKDGNDIGDLSRSAVEAVISSLATADVFEGNAESMLNDPDNYVVRLINRSRNNGYLEKLAVKDAGCGFVYIVSAEYGEYGVSLTKDILKAIGMTEEELFDAAIENSVRRYPALLCSLQESVFTPHEECENLLDFGPGHAPAAYGPAFVLTNSRFFWGAAALFYPGVIGRIHELLDDDFYVLPSSVHEVIVLAASGQEPELLADTIRAANRSVVREQEILADDLYMCRSGEMVRVSYGGEIPENSSKVC